MVVVKTFGWWLEQQAGRRGPVGDLARDYIQACDCLICDGRVGRDETVVGVRSELDAHGAAGDLYNALVQAVSEWRKVAGTEPVLDQRLACSECGSDRPQLPGNPEVTQAKRTARNITQVAYCGNCGHRWRIVIQLEGDPGRGGVLRLLVYP